jgi:transposase
VANQLKMALIDTIHSLHEQGWSGRRIARELRLDRDTVARYLRQALPSKPATSEQAPHAIERLAKPATPGEALSDLSVLATPSPTDEPVLSAAASATAESAAITLGVDDSGSQCVPFHEIIVVKLDQGLSVQRIWQDLVGEHGFSHKYHSVRRYVAKLAAVTPLPFRRLECGPGEEVQVDFGQGAWIKTPAGQRRRPHVFRMVLSHSRKGYSEVVLRQTTDSFLLCLENAFWHFGGVARRVVLDNLKAAVLQADWFDPELHPKIQAFAKHYGCVFLPTKPRMPRHKGKVERGIDYVQENALRGRTFATLAEQNQFLARWEAEVADPRVHGTTRQAVGPHYLHVEKAALLPLPGERFANFQEAQRWVHRDGYIEVNKAYYSVPPEYVNQAVWVRWDARLVRVFNLRLAQIALHAQQPPGKFSTQNTHIASAKINAVEGGVEPLLAKVRRLGAGCGQWAEAMLQSRGVLGTRVLQGLLHLARQHPAEALCRACAVAHAHGEYRLRTLRALVKRQQVPQADEAFLDEHPLIRPLRDYEQCVRAALGRSPGDTR